MNRSMHNNLNFVLLFSFIAHLGHNLITVAGSVCDLVSCGQGTCKASSSLLGFECECKPGWNKAHIGSLTFPSCTVPNCTVNYHCETSPIPSSPPPPPPRPTFNLLDPCSLAWCGDGTCMKNGTGISCKCNPGSVNLSNSTNMACLKQCSLGASCNDLGIAIPMAPPSNPHGSDPKLGGSSGSPPIDSKNGSSGVLRCSGILELLSVLLIIAIFHGWLS